MMKAKAVTVDSADTTGVDVDVVREHEGGDDRRLGICVIGCTVSIKWANPPSRCC